MQTVNFNCSCCNKLMAVGLNLLGRNVRCPHCKQVVQAPASPTSAKQPPSALQTQSVPSPKRPSKSGDVQESIFGEAPSDDLFGRTQSPAASEPLPLPDSRFAHPTRLEQTGYNAQPYSPTVDMPPPAGPLPWQNDDRTELSAPIRNDEPDERPIAYREPIAREGGGGGIFVWMLLLYALIATGIAAWLFYERTQADEKKAAGGYGDKEHPFFAIPDFYGQYERADRKKIQTMKGMPDPTLPVPKELQAKLQETIKIGDLEVTPVKVEYRQVRRFRKYPDKPAAPPRNNPEVYLYLLHLRIKNTSSDVQFCPTDPAFARRKESPPREVRPYTGIFFGKSDYLGGPFLWPDSDFEYEFIEDQKDDHVPLAPGEERTYVIGCDMNITPIKNALQNAPDDPIMWRVQLRRGLMKFKKEDGEEVDISVSCVIGVNLENADFPKNF